MTPRRNSLASPDEDSPSPTLGRCSIFASDGDVPPISRPDAARTGELRCSVEVTDERLNRLVRWFVDKPVENHREGRLAIRLRLAKHDIPDFPDSLREHWSGTPNRLTVQVENHLETTIDVRRARIDGWVSERLLDKLPETAARLLIEAPLATARAGHGWQAVHAATVVGPQGAVVIRGASGRGKSTLAAGAWKAGLEVLGDESVLAQAPGHRDLVASVREVLIRAETAAMLDLDGDRIVTTTGDSKLRLRLRPIEASRRSATHAATVFLGDRDRPGGARLTPIDSREFQAEFDAAEIPQERWYGSPQPLVDHWSSRPAYRLDGATDLGGAIALLHRICHGETR